MIAIWAAVGEYKIRLYLLWAFVTNLLSIEQSLSSFSLLTSSALFMSPAIHGSYDLSTFFWNAYLQITIKMQYFGTCVLRSNGKISQNLEINLTILVQYKSSFCKDSQSSFISWFCTHYLYKYCEYSHSLKANSKVFPVFRDNNYNILQ
jgi:hypothetical protein